MILSIILLILLSLIIALLIIFLFFVFFPSIKNNDLSERFLLDTNFGEDFIPHAETKVSNKKAFILCNCNKKFKQPMLDFNEMYTCFIAKSVNNSNTDCKFSCLGLGDCVKICPQEAIEIINNTAKITDNCCGCGKCVNICPQNIISLIDPSENKSIQCKNDNSITSCNQKEIELKTEWVEKKYFKLWKRCYKLYKSVFTRIKF